MNYRKVFNVLGVMLLCLAVLMLLPIIVAVIYKEDCITSFIAAAALAAALGGILLLLCKPKREVIYAKDGFAIVALSWIAFSLIGALPFFFSREIPHYIDAVFETISGFTTTGASILTDIEALSHATLFWRSFTHWVGGMGVLVFIMALMPNLSDRSIHIMRAEMPGHVVGKLVPRAKDTAKILYLIYIVMTMVEVILLCAGGMSFFDSLIHSFGTAGTGGFGIKSDSIAGYSPYCQWVITVFMFLFGVNFNVYYLILIRRFKYIFKSEEIWCYTGIVLASITVICINIRSMYDTLSESLRHAAFQVSTIITTTGYSTTDFDLWPDLSKAILLILMFIGACSGSTGGGLKVSRVVILVKMIIKEIRRSIRPRSINTVKFEGKQVDEITLNSVNNYFSLYILCFVAMFLLVSFEPFGFESNFSAVVACFNNIGPGFAAVGPTSSFAEYSYFSKVILGFAMLLGRLEIFPLIITLSPYTWKKK
ncbi:MAG: TrkH family potassium uptake protein [Clostridia bacterium]|nr:TrkH family potassium uptake protein [Clostridia bacterium]